MIDRGTLPKIIVVIIVLIIISVVLLIAELTDELTTDDRGVMISPGGYDYIDVPYSWRSTRTDIRIEVDSNHPIEIALMTEGAFVDTYLLGTGPQTPIEAEVVENGVVDWTVEREEFDGEPLILVFDNTDLGESVASANVIALESRIQLTYHRNPLLTTGGIFLVIIIALSAAIVVIYRRQRRKEEKGEAYRELLTAQGP